MKKLLLGITLLIYVSGLTAQEFLYPVASFLDADGHQQLYVLYQKSIEHVELWQWDPQASLITKALPSMFTPSGIRMLADGTGFSFIDNGRIRIKKSAMRSPQAIDIFDPISDVRPVEWISDNVGYFWAKRHDRFAIFQLSMNGTIDIIAGGSRTYDCMFPQKIGSDLFYIERSDNEHDYHYEVVQALYPELLNQSLDFNDSASFDVRVKAMFHTLTEKSEQRPAVCNARTMVTFDNRPIACLYMVDATRGFVVEHIQSMDNDGRLQEQFCYHQLIKAENAHYWTATPLFYFTIPTALISPMHDDRLYESIIPLMPRYHNDNIYFVDSNNSSSLNIFIYMLSSGDIEQKTWANPEQQFFVPIIIGDTIFCGGTFSLHDTSSILAEEILRVTFS